MTHGYRLRVEDQGGAADILRRIGALTEIEQAVVTHCKEHTPKPPYRPQEIKKRLAPSWRPEVRVPPFEPQYDDLPINDRYDLWKSFELDGGTQIGVAIEMERWEVWTDLLKFRRGIQRRQIAVGVILHDNPANLHYVYHHLRLISEPLFSALPVMFAAPEGEGLETAAPPSSRRFAPYRMPNDPAV